MMKYIAFNVLLVGLGLALLNSCGGQTASFNHGPAPSEPAITGAERPDNIDPTTWGQLLSELNRVVTEAGFVSEPHLARAEVSTVSDLAVEVGGEDHYNLSWTYSNPGDYDLNGEVNAADLALIGIHLGKTSTDPGWAEAQLADGNGDGEISIQDVTPIGQHFRNTISGYVIAPEWGDGDGNGESNLTDVYITACWSDTQQLVKFNANGVWVTGEYEGWFNEQIAGHPAGPLGPWTGILYLPVADGLALGEPSTRSILFEYHPFWELEGYSFVIAPIYDRMPRVLVETDIGSPSNQVILPGGIVGWLDS